MRKQTTTTTKWYSLNTPETLNINKHNNRLVFGCDGFVTKLGQIFGHLRKYLGYGVRRVWRFVSPDWDLSRKVSCLFAKKSFVRVCFCS
mmetsp:Transcript_24002/g.27646  ORF Transcript_24002/g.27646 Transcript_24002/m.27646 type:complete len:89 (-) Transcript_24002:796-1062(-)